ncbi:MAG: metallophosphoesterase family protein [Bacillota bacterium]|uniref:metallophosphoesterase family protein n=1 Tax=Desulfurispora thermophila TaxID=265470 RepID=UPI000370EC9D|nr:metallophosphoesterase family protein [Desulfurispora thermophila]
MQLAFISDIHANLPALQSVWEDIVQRQCEQVYCLGDLVGYAPFVNEVIDFIREKNISCVQGNYDDAVGNYRLLCGCDFADDRARELGEKSLYYTQQTITAENRAFLAGLPAQLRFTLHGWHLLMVHGSPLRNNEYLKPDTPDDYLNSLLEQFSCQVLVCGHTHLPYIKKLPAGLVINAGSVGRPKHGSPSATYIVVQLGESISGQVVEVPYNVAATVQELRRAGLPEEFARLLETGNG